MRGAVAALALLLICGGSIATAAKSSSCFRHSEAVADQAIRYTTEIMVMSDTCRNQAYDHFAQRNRTELVGFQEALKEHFRRAAGRRAQATLDTFMTHLANEAALRTGLQDINHVCLSAVPFLATADKISGESFRQYAETQLKEHGADYKFCKE